MSNLVEKDLSYKIVGVLFDVYNNLGGGYQEKYYQKAVANELNRSNIEFTEQIAIPLEYKGDSIGRYFLDFLIEKKIVLEIKAGNFKFYPRDVRQILAYLKSSEVTLGILANFGRRNLQLKRVLKGLK